METKLLITFIQRDRTDVTSAEFIFCHHTKAAFIWRGTNLEVELPVTYPAILFGGFIKFSWGQRADTKRIWRRQPPSQGFRSICKWMKRIFLLGSYGCIFHETGNSAQLCQNFVISVRHRQIVQYPTQSYELIEASSAVVPTTKFPSHFGTVSKWACAHIRWR
jgi:hypothetical protein